jgi:hypothetical protein
VSAGVLGRLAGGAVAGATATVAMTVCMVAAERLRIMPGQPPRMVVDRFIPDLEDRKADRTAILLHLAYGAAAGAALRAATGARAVGPRAGIAYAIALWAAGYEGWVPAVGVLPPAHRDHRGRVAAMLAAHVVYGWTLSGLLRAV